MSDPLYQPAANRERPGPLLCTVFVFAVLGGAALLLLALGFWPLR